MIELVLGNPEQQASGNLFGLWTTDGKPVIHIISGRHGSCTERDPDLADISGKDCPLSHIGNWRFSDSFELFQPDSRQIEHSRCCHEIGGTFLLLTIGITKSTHEVKLSCLITYQKHSSSPMNFEKCNVKLLETESPFKNVKEIALSNSRLHKYFDTGEKMEWSPSQVSRAFPSNSLNYQSHTLAGNSFPREDMETEVLPSINAKQSRALFVTNNHRFQSDFASNRDLNVFMFKEDYQMMVKLVLEYPNLETGGDLFGLWTSDGDAVLHAVLGPGRNCKRTGASFYQDVPYLKRNGELLTQDYMLCHIGEWHSHHQLRLFQPSHGDSSTVIRNYPRGACGFLLIIANIVSSSDVKLLPYLYTEKSTYDFDKVGNIVVLPSKNSFNGIKKIKQAKEMGREIKPHSQYVYSQNRYNHFQQSPTSPPGVRTTLARYRKVQKHNSGTYTTSMQIVPWRP